MKLINQLKKLNLRYDNIHIICFVLIYILGIITKGTSKIQQLNNLPDDRNETTSIKDIYISHEKGKFYVHVFIKYIYEITLEQHIKFFKLCCKSEAFSKCYDEYGKIDQIRNGNNFTFVYPSELEGNGINITFYRSKTLLYTTLLNNVIKL